MQRIVREDANRQLTANVLATATLISKVALDRR
jgi:hypothetical protein